MREGQSMAVVLDYRSDMKVTLALTLNGKSLWGSEQKDDETQRNTKGALRLLDGSQTEGKEGRWRWDMPVAHTI